MVSTREQHQRLYTEADLKKTKNYFVLLTVAPPDLDKLLASPCTQVQAHGGQCLHQEVTLSTKCSKRKGLVPLPQQERQELVLLTPAFGTKHTHAPRTDPSQTPVAARPSMVPTAPELSVEKCPPPSLKLPSCFSHQQPQNRLFPTPCFIWEYCPTRGQYIRGVYLNLTRGVESLLETLNWFEFGGTSYLHHHVSRTMLWRSVIYPRTHTASAERRSMSIQSPPSSSL